MTSRSVRPLRILMISSEVESLARTGGLGDVVAALSLALAEAGAEVLVVTPLYGVTRLPSGEGALSRWPEPVDVRWGWGPSDVRRAEVVELAPIHFASGGVRRICLLDEPGLFMRRGIYGDAHGEFGDNALRFAVMSRGALEISARAWDGGPDVVHAHDWHAAFAILYAKTVMGRQWAAVPSVFTIHNLAFQGVFDEGILDALHLPREAFRPEILWHDGRVNMMKGALALSECITTVSPTYAREILTPAGGFGLDTHLRAHRDRLVGILNGIDAESANPKTDPALARGFDTTSRTDGRSVCKAALVRELGLDATDGPLFGMVGRFTWQKGLDLLLPIVDDIVERGGRVVLVGEGDAHLEALAREAARSFPGRVATHIAFDPPLSRRIYAGVDFFFVPSRFEPCGLTQMYAMRYGAIPIVTNVGGLHDTVEPIGEVDGVERGTGFVTERPDVDALRVATQAAFALYADRDALARASVRGMTKDFSWTSPARQYQALFHRLNLASTTFLASD